MAILDQVQKDIVTAMKAKDEGRLGALRMVKQRRESADVFRKNGREELAVKEEAEIAVIEGYLPGVPSAQELEAAVSAAIAETGATSAKQMGLVMKAAQAKLAGKRIDGKALSELVKSKLP